MTVPIGMSDHLYGSWFEIWCKSIHWFHFFFHDDLLTWTAHSSITPWLKKTTTKNSHFIWLHMTVTNWLKLICAAILPKLIVIVINQSNFKRFALMGWLSGVQNFGYLSSIHLINPPLFDCLFLFDPDYSIVNFIFFSLFTIQTHTND